MGAGDHRRITERSARGAVEIRAEPGPSITLVSRVVSSRAKRGISKRKCALRLEIPALPAARVPVARDDVSREIGAHFMSNWTLAPAIGPSGRSNVNSLIVGSLNLTFTVNG